MTWGLLRPVVLLPADAENWSEERRRLVLLHELAHVQRADCLTQFLAHLACALYWFNPLTWLAARQLRVERERACDDQVLAGGVKASAYAEHLLEIARLARRASCASVAAVAMARPSQLEGRLLAVLDANRSRTAVSRLAALVAVVAGSGIVVPLAALEAAARAGQSGDTERSIPRPAGEMGLRRIWTGPDVDYTGTVSTDGRYLSYVDWMTGDLAVRDLAAGSRRRVTNKGSWERSSEFAVESLVSPDGKQFAYAWFNREERYELRLIRSDGSRLRVLYSNPEVEYITPAAWFPNGKRILALLSRKGKTNQIALISVADGSVSLLKSLDWRRPQKMSLSPDGRTIAYDFQPLENSPQRDIYLLAADASREICLVQHPANDYRPVWAPDGRRLLFVSDRTGTFGIWAITVTNGRSQGSPELVKADQGLMTPLGFGPNGSLYYGVRIGKDDVYTAMLDMENGRILAPAQQVSHSFVGANSRPAWSPDGRYLAYVTSANQGGGGGSFAFSLQSVKSGEVHQLSPHLNSISSLAATTDLSWSSDGQFLLVTGRDQKSRLYKAFRIDAQTGAVTAFPGTDTDMGWAVWSPDGKAVFYVASDSKGYHILTRDLATGQDKELYRGFANDLALSPDGRQLVFRFSNQDAAAPSWSLKVMPTAGGEPRELCRMKRPGTFGRVRWFPDGRQLLFGWETEKTTELWRVSADGGEPQQMGVTMDHARHLSIHPDGRQIAFTAGKSRREVWVMENYLPTRTGRSTTARP
jgi:Tol biopolymer transport system component